MSRKRSKEATWRGYFERIVRQAEREGVPPLEKLDREWAQGRQTAETCVLPYLTPTAKALEIACGIGRVSRFVAPHCAELCCTDILDEALKGCAENTGPYKNVSFIRTNGYDLKPLEDASFDCVYSFTAFLHLDWELVVAYFAEIRRVLKDGGTAILEFKQWKKKEDVDQLLNKIRSQGGLAAYEGKLDKWRYVSAEMLDLLCSYYELEPVDRDTTHYTFRKPAMDVGAAE